MIASLAFPYAGLSVPLGKEIEELNAKIDQKKEDSVSARDRLERLGEELALLISDYQQEYAKLHDIDEAVAKKQSELKSATEQQIYYQRILNRLNVFTYRDGDIYFLEVVLGTRSFKDLLVRLDYLTKLNERQAQVLSATKRLRETVEKRRDELAGEKNKQKATVDGLEDKRLRVDRLLAEQQQLLDSLGDDIEGLKAAKKTKLEEKAQAKSEAEARARAASANVDINVDIDILFPVPSTYASSYINDWGFPRAGNEAGHQGTDIFAQKGTPLVAVTDGVIGEEFGDSRVGGFRLHIIDDRGVDYYYAHLNNDTPGTDDGLGGSTTAFAPGIAPGVRVARGQVVGYVGDSGDAEPTPPHLHFGIKVGSRWTPPYAYLKAASWM